MSLQQLKYVLEIVKHRSLNKAAKHLFISQPSLSNAVKELEKEIGITIFSRTNKGIALTTEGIEFVGYARQVVEQAELLEQRYLNRSQAPAHFRVSTQHYAFAVNAFVEIVKQYGRDQYELALCETRTHDIIEDVRLLRSEIGVIYMTQFNRQVISKLLRDAGLQFTKLFVANPHVFISINHPLANRPSVTMDDLMPYPYLSFDQGEFNSFYFAEEILSTLTRPKNIKVTDRATLFNLLIGLHGYTVSTGVLTEDLNGSAIIPVPLDIHEPIDVGWISHKNLALSALGQAYIQALHRQIQQESALEL